MQGVVKRIFFVISTICFVMLFSSFMEERLVYVHETSHPAQRGSVSYGAFHHDFPASRAVIQIIAQAYIAWKAFKLPWPFNHLFITVDLYLSTKKDPFYKGNACSNLLLLPYQVSYADILAFIARVCLVTWLVIRQ